MDIMQAMRERHSVRSYLERPLDERVKSALLEEIGSINRESGLHVQLAADEPRAFDCLMAHYGKFSGVRNYIALAGKKTKDLDERCGYYGERLVLLAQQLGLNTCWVALTYRKSAFRADPGEKLAAVIAVGYGAAQGVPHKSKPIEAVASITGETPGWFVDGVNAALLAPTAVNQQKFTFSLEGGTVTARAGVGFYARIDLGIVKYHFELGAGTENFRWA